MSHRPVLIFGLLALAACRAGDEAAPGAARDTLVRATRAPAVAYRLPSGGGPILVYELPALRQTPWGGGGLITGAREAVGSDLQGRRLLFRGRDGVLASFDLVALRERSIAPARFMAALASDGTLLAVDSGGEVIESQPWGTRAWQARLGRGVREAFAAPGARLIVLRRGPSDSLEIVAHEGTRIFASAAPEATARAATPAGDAIAFATAQGVTVIETSSDTARWSVPLEGVTAVVFSPSGHRIYAALRERREIAVIDRFARRRRGSIALPGPALALRPDPWGRVLLARGQGTAGDTELWVISVGAQALLRRLASPWASDLPAVTESGVLLLREGTAVVARDARRLDSLGAAPGGAADLWFTGRWVAASATAAARAEQAGRSPRGGASERPSGAAAQPRGMLAPDAAAPTRGGTVDFWVQIASSRSEQAIRDLARELGAQAVPPRTDSDPWRVMAGPYRTRQAADSAGRALGRPYFVTERPRSP